jgi:hypothetical protein
MDGNLIAWKGIFLGKSELAVETPGYAGEIGYWNRTRIWKFEL